MCITPIRAYPLGKFNFSSKWHFLGIHTVHTVFSVFKLPVCVENISPGTGHSLRIQNINFIEEWLISSVLMKQGPQNDDVVFVTSLHYGLSLLSSDTSDDSRATR